MPTNLHDRPASRSAFTIVELLVVVGTVCLLACFMMPAFARSKIQSPAAGCLSNLRQMQLGSTMYKDDNNDVLIPNAPAAGPAPTPNWCPTSAEGWGVLSANTNRNTYTNTLLWPYVARDINIYRCPGDVKPSANGFRIRSYSMNGQMGMVTNFSLPNYNPGYRIYLKGSDLTCPTPANAFTICDESMYTLNDGYFQVDLNNLDYPSVPAGYLGGGCGFSFADGHAEVHKWIGPIVPAVPYQYGVVINNGVRWPSSTQDQDYKWLYQHAACHQ